MADVFSDPQEPQNAPALAPELQEQTPGNSEAGAGKSSVAFLPESLVP